MDFDNSFKALLTPGETENFFDVAGLSDFEPIAKQSYSRPNALWLIEFCRLIYRQEKDEIPQRPNDFITRDQILRRKGWQERDFFNSDDCQAGIFVNEQLRCAALVFRGTLGLDDTFCDGECIPVPWDGGALVHLGFQKQLEAVWSAIEDKLSELNTPVFLTGHSLGAALATLAAARVLRKGILRQPAALYTYGSPRIGSAALSGMLSGLFHCRMVNNRDAVPTLPPKLPAFHHVGQMHRIDRDGRLHIYPANLDPIKIIALMTAEFEAIESVRTLLRQPLPPPELSDHTPVNYTAKIERAAIA